MLTTGSEALDAPAVRQAQIGVSFLNTGRLTCRARPVSRRVALASTTRTATPVAKNAADLLLIHDDFPSMVNAVELGRVVFANVQK